MWKLWLLILVYQIRSLVGVGEISMQKCEEYAKAVYSQQLSPVLLPTAQSNSVSQCGIVEVPLIVGGVKSQSKEFPHMALIGFGFSANSELSWQCGGSLISELFVLTAAHCMDSREKGPAQKVRLGAISTNSNENVQEIPISQKIPHADYKPPKKYDDIGLMKLAQAVQFTATVRPACLNREASITSPKAIAIGFGKTSYEAQDTSNYLMKVQLSLIANSACQQSFSSAENMLALPNGITPSIICAGELSGGKDTCQGDSGGPLQIVLSKPYCMYSIIGVTSFGKFCGFSNSPAFYSRVSSYLDWIESVVWK